MYGRPRYLLSSSAKAEKCQTVGVLNQVLYLTSGVFCPRATEACLALCLGHTSGRMQMPSSAVARDRRTALYIEDQEHFLDLLRADIRYVRDRAHHEGLVPAVRLNGTSDISWEHWHPEILDEFPDVEFFDYTKLSGRMSQFLGGRAGSGTWPNNYHLTFSVGEKTSDRGAPILDAGGNVAVVFWPHLPKTWLGYPIIDGDLHDARFLDPKGVVVGLSAKGIAREDLSGFVVRTDGRTSLWNAA